MIAEAALTKASPIVTEGGKCERYDRAPLTAAAAVGEPYWNIVHRLDGEKISLKIDFLSTRAPLEARS